MSYLTGWSPPKELVERFSKEPVIALEHIRDIRHTAALPEIGMSVPVIIAFSKLDGVAIYRWRVRR